MSITARMSRAATCTILLVQHSADDGRYMYAEFLDHHGFVTIVVSSAADALKIASLANVVVTGIRLDREADGLELIARLRDDRHTKNTPIIVLTASVSATNRERAKSAGCDVFLAKPCLPEVLLLSIRGLLTPGARDAKPNGKSSGSMSWRQRRLH